MDIISMFAGHTIFFNPLSCVILFWLVRIERILQSVITEAAVRKALSLVMQADVDEIKKHTVP